MQESEENHKTRLDHEAQLKATERNIRNIEETDEERDTRLIDKAVSERTRRGTRNFMVRVLFQFVNHMIE